MACKHHVVSITMQAIEHAFAEDGREYLEFRVPKSGRIKSIGPATVDGDKLTITFDTPLEVSLDDVIEIKLVEGRNQTFSMKVESFDAPATE